MNPRFFHRRKTIGLLGGSFNPAHEGHVHISREACKRLGLGQVVWLVSPQNPLKPTQGMAPFAQRLQSAKTMAAGQPQIVVSDVEQELHTRYTVDTLRALKRHVPNAKFVWIMGADNLAQVHRWECWANIFNLCPVLVVDRAPFSQSSLRAKAAIRFSKWKCSGAKLRLLADCNTPALGFLHLKRHPASSTAIRAAHNNA